MTPDIIQRIIERFGSQQRLADAIGCDQSTVAWWKRRGCIPARRQVQILRAARARGIALTPDDFFDPSEVGDAA